MTEDEIRASIERMIERDAMRFDTLSELDKAWADIYWTFQEEAFDLSDNHIGRYTAPVPFSNDKYFSNYAEMPF